MYSIGSRHTSGGLSKRWSTKSRNAVLTVMNYAASAPARRGESPATNGTSRVCGWSRRPRMVRMDLAQHASTGGYPRARACCLLSKPANVAKRPSPERLRVHSARDWSKQSTCGFQAHPPADGTAPSSSVRALFVPPARGSPNPRLISFRPLAGYYTLHAY